MISGPWLILNALSFLLLYMWVAYFVSQETHWSVGLAFFFCFLSAIFSANGFLYPGMDEFHQLSTMAICCTLLIAYVARQVEYSVAMSVVGIINVLNSILVISQMLYFQDKERCGGLLLNSSMNASFLAVTVLSVPWALIPLTVIAIFISGASTPFAILLSMFSCLIIAERKSWKLILTASVLLVVVAFFIPDLMNDNGRFLQWKAAISYYKEHIGFLGAGAGAYFRHGAIISKMREFSDRELWTMLHNDWLQVFFEGGFLAVSSLVTMVSFMLYRAWNRPQLFASIIGYSVFGFFNMPLRYIPTALIGAFLVKESFTNNRKVGG